MSNDNLFRIFYPVLYFLSIILGMLPRFLYNFLWSVTSIFDGLLAISLRYCLIRSSAAFVGKKLYIGKYVTLKSLKYLSIGDNVSIHEMCYIDASGVCEIGNNVSISHGVSILTFNHCWDDPRKPIKYNQVEFKKVILEDDVWVGCGVRIMGGVRIGTRSVVAAGAVVTRDVPPNSLVGGVPAKLMKHI